ncbi:MAG: hypothetical protein BGP03_05850 [Pseudonocardia sp. 73-21]|nr:MAG: hypothetical protein BGP03_05850 [Pseudonocardia sp. 73-21]
MSHATGWEGAGPDLMTVVARAGDDPDPRHSLAVSWSPGRSKGSRSPGCSTRSAIARLLPRFTLRGVHVPTGNRIGEVGDGLGTVTASFGGALIGARAAGVMRSAFDVALNSRGRTAGAAACPSSSTRASGSSWPTSRPGSRPCAR